MVPGRVRGGRCWLVTWPRRRCGTGCRARLPGGGLSSRVISVPGGRGVLLGQRYGLPRQIQVRHGQDDRVLRARFAALPAGHSPPPVGPTTGLLRAGGQTGLPGRGPGIIWPAVVRSHA